MYKTTTQHTITVFTLQNPSIGSFFVFSVSDDPNHDVAVHRNDRDVIARHPRTVARELWCLLVAEGYTHVYTV